MLLVWFYLCQLIINTVFYLFFFFANYLLHEQKQAPYNLLGRFKKLFSLEMASPDWPQAPEVAEIELRFLIFTCTFQG